jgi:hypothetical protein
MGGKFTKLCAIGLQIKLNTCSWVELWQSMLTIIYIKATMVSVCVGSAWKILPVTARSLWCALGGGGRESPVKHRAGGPARAGGGHGRGRIGRGRTGRGGARRVHYALGSH